MEVFNYFFLPIFHSCIFEYVEELMCGYIRDTQVGYYLIAVWCNDIHLIVSLIILIIEVI